MRGDQLARALDKLPADVLKLPVRFELVDTDSLDWDVINTEAHTDGKLQADGTLRWFVLVEGRKVPIRGDARVRQDGGELVVSVGVGGIDPNTTGTPVHDFDQGPPEDPHEYDTGSRIGNAIMGWIYENKRRYRRR